MINKNLIVSFVVIVLAAGDCCALFRRQEQRRQQRSAELGVGRISVYRASLQTSRRRRTIVGYENLSSDSPLLSRISIEPNVQFSFDRFSEAVEQDNARAALIELSNSDVNKIFNTVSRSMLQPVLDAIVQRLYVDIQRSIDEISLWHEIVQQFISAHKKSAEFFLNTAVSHGDLVFTCEIMKVLELSHKRALGRSKAKLFNDIVTQIGRLLPVAIENGNLDVALYLYTGAYENPLNPNEFVARAASWLSYAELDTIRNSAKKVIESLETRCAVAKQDSLNETAQKIDAELKKARLLLNTLEADIAHKLVMR